MMKNPGWTPWHQVVAVRDDVRTGELSLSLFAADLYAVAMGTGPLVYRDPREFFALTYPTYNLRELAKDVVLRLAGRNTKAVRQLELTYGGGKTHTLVTLYHLVSDPAKLPQLSSVKEFVEHIGINPPRARIAVLAFDKLDVEKGMEVRAPDGELRWLKHPWSVLAFQIAGRRGLELLHADGLDAERESAPAENLLEALLALPAQEGLSTLVLIDEVLMYAREKIGFDDSWRSRLLNFFQYLTQAATKVNRCAIVASLLATDPNKSDVVGKEITRELYAIFRREREEGVQPVGKEDVAEVLRRRFFTPETLVDRERFRPHVVAAVKGIGELDDATRREGITAEERFFKSYPFHPDLTEVFYTKWVQLESFQRARGILRTFALALRDAATWDESPLVGPQVLLDAPGKSSLSEAATDLTTVAASEDYEGKRQEWSSILEGELKKAIEIEKEFPSLRNREVEAAVVAAFIHSQPIGQKAATRDLLTLLGQTRPDKIELEKALRRWTEVSWFLDETAMADAETAPDGSKLLPKSWRLGSRPNLRQMHADACLGVSAALIESKLEEGTRGLKSLTAGASAIGAKVHNLPQRPNDVDDDGEFHYAVLGPKTASIAGRPSSEAKRFLEETTASDRPRVRRNSVVLAVPSVDGLDVARGRIRDSIGWEEVWNRLKDTQVDAVRLQTLTADMEKARERIPEATAQAYCLVVALSEKAEVEAFKVAVGGKSLFISIKEDPRSRIQDAPIEAAALLPEGAYDLWRPGETSRRVKTLVDAFAEKSELPKMLRRQSIVDTLVQGCVDGLYVLRLTRPDRSFRTFWRSTPDNVALKDPALELVLPEAAALADFAPSLLGPKALPGLWQGDSLFFEDVVAYFGGNRVVKIERGGFSEAVAVPSADRKIVEDATRAAVKDGFVWLTFGNASLLAEDVPSGILTDESILRAPPAEPSVLSLLPENLSAAWTDGEATGLSLLNELSRSAGLRLPWVTVGKAISSALTIRYLVLADDSIVLPCTFDRAVEVRLRVPADEPTPKPYPKPVGRVRDEAMGALVAESDLGVGEIQDLAEKVSAIKKTLAGYDLKFTVRIEVGGYSKPSADTVAAVNLILKEVSDKLELA